jgi:hypothetical protein
VNIVAAAVHQSRVLGDVRTGSFFLDRERIEVGSKPHGWLPFADVHMNTGACRPYLGVQAEARQKLSDPSSGLELRPRDLRIHVEVAAQPGRDRRERSCEFSQGLRGVGHAASLARPLVRPLIAAIVPTHRTVVNT